MNTQAISRRLNAAIKEAALNEAQARKFRARVLGEENAVLPAIKRTIVARLQATIAETGTAVITLGRVGKYRVYSLDGYRATQANTKKHRIWEKTPNAKAAAKNGAAASVGAAA